MKLLTTAALLVAAALAGCASAPGSSPATSSSQASTPGTTQASSRTQSTANNRPLYVPPSPSANTEPISASVPLDNINAQIIGPRNVMSVAPPTDLWVRIRNGYAIPNLENALVRDREQWYATRPDYIFRMTERSKKYLFHIVEELEVRGMPSELALLPFIESAFNPRAVSGAKAAGMWQFMPATGKYFELKQNAFRDDRRDVLASTRAALDYLKKLHGMFGDWHLALAAYNWGEGNVGRAIATNRRAGRGTGYLDLNMPMETRLYVPKLQAVKNIVGDPQLFNSQLPLIENHPYFQSVPIRRDIDVVLAAKLAEVPLEDFQALNPSIDRPVILAAGTSEILLPWDNAAVFQSNLEGYAGGRLASWTVWVAPSTMHPKVAAKRVGMTEADLRRVNRVPARMLIRAGSSLLVPRSARMANDVTERVADNGQLSLAREQVLKRTTVRAGKGDTVASIARRYNINPSSVAQWNKVSVSASFKPGRIITLYTTPSTRRAKPKVPAAQRRVSAPVKPRTGQVAKQ